MFKAVRPDPAPEQEQLLHLDQDIKTVIQASEPLPDQDYSLEPDYKLGY